MNNKCIIANCNRKTLSETSFVCGVECGRKYAIIKKQTMPQTTIIDNGAPQHQKKYSNEFEQLKKNIISLITVDIDKKELFFRSKMKPTIVALSEYEFTTILLWFKKEYLHNRELEYIHKWITKARYK